MRPAALIDVAVVALVRDADPLDPSPSVPSLRWSWPLVIAGVATLAWNRWTGLIVSDRRTADSDSFVEALGRSLGGIPLTVHQAIGALGWNEFFAPVAAQLLWIVVLALARVLDVHAFVPPLVACSVDRCRPVASNTRRGDRSSNGSVEIWQGRYSISFAMAGVLFAASCVSPDRAGRCAGSWQPRRAPRC